MGMTEKGFPVSMVRSELLSTLTPKMANSLNTVYLTQFAVHRCAQYCLSSRPLPCASRPCQNRSTVAHIFTVNIEPTLTLLSGLLPSLSLHMPPSEVGAGLWHCLKNTQQGERLGIYNTQVPPWRLQGLPRGTTLQTPEVEGS